MSGRRAPLGKTLLIAGACALVPLLGNVSASFVTDWTGGGSWLVVPVVGVVGAMLTALIQAYGSTGEPAYPAPGPPQGRGYRRERNGAPVAVVLLVAVLVLGVGGWGITAGVRYATGYVTGNESGTERLARPASATSGDLTLTVQSVEYTAHFTRVVVTARNAGTTSVSLPLFGYCKFVGSDGTTLDADAFRSDWSTMVAPGLQRGTITFKGHLPASVLRAALKFTQIFGPGGGAIAVEVALTPPSP